MKIFFFPVLVIDELMKQLKPVELVSLSLCSKNAHAFVKTFANTNKGLQIDLSFYYDVYFISFRRHPIHASIRVTSNQPRFCGPSGLESIHGLDYSFDKTGQLYTCWQDVVQGCQMTTNYVCDLLKIPVTTISIYRADDLWLLDFAQQRQEQKLKSLRSSNPNISAQAYSIIMSYNATERLEVTAVPREDYRFVGKLSTAKTLIIQWGHWITREHLLGLESSFAQLRCTRLTIADINASLRSWLNGGLPNLKYLDIDLRICNNRIYEGVRDRLEAVRGEIRYKWDEFKSAARFNSNAFHIRGDDGIVATVMNDGFLFMMAVLPNLNGNLV